MTPRQMAQAECANLCKDGSCLGIPARCLTSRPTVAAPRSSCLLGRKRKKLDLGPEPRRFTTFAELDRFLDQAEANASTSGDFYLCEYFEKAVLPLAKSYPQYVSAVEQYNDRLPLNKHLGNARLCGCGAPLQKRHQYCPKCKRERQKQARRKWWRNGGSRLDNLPQKNGPDAPKTQ